jgi:hypothetical protein
MFALQSPRCPVPFLRGSNIWEPQYTNCSSPEHDAITDTLDYLLGALYGLSRAHHLGFRERKGKHFLVYRPHLANYALEIPKNGEVNCLWSAGFYFNSAIQRLASAFDRIPRMLRAKMTKKVAAKRVSTSAKERMGEVNPASHTNWELLYDEVNHFKHSPEGRAAGRTVTLEDALRAFEQTVDLLKSGTPTLVARYK